MNKIWFSLGLVVLGLAILVVAAFGQTTEVKANVSPSQTITVNSVQVSMGALTVGGTNTATAANLLSVATNHDIVLQAYEAGADGKMSDGTHTLFNPLKVGVDSFTPTAISGGAGTVSDMISAQTSTNHGVTFVQPVQYPDYANTGYSIIVTFAATS